MTDHHAPTRAVPAEIWPLGRWTDMVTLIAEAAEVSPDEAERRLALEYHRSGANVDRQLTAAGIEPSVWSDRLVDWYEQNDAFLFDSLAWNSSPNKEAMRVWIIEYLRRAWAAPGRILCFGDGLGIDTAALAHAGHQVTYAEPSIRCRRFAAQVFQHNDVRPEVAESLDDFKPETFDGVVCLDVLEHLPEPAGLVAKLTSLLKRDGLLVVHAPFWFRDPTHLRSNIRHSGRWREIYGSSGLSPRDGRMLWNPLVLARPEASVSQLTTAARIRLAIGGRLLRAEGLAPWFISPLARLASRFEARSVRQKLKIA